MIKHLFYEIIIDEHMNHVVISKYGSHHCLTQRYPKVNSSDSEYIRVCSYFDANNYRAYLITLKEIKL
jgi:glutathionylspermidine synthase